MAKLNGWQRLWVLVTVFWTVAVLSVGYLNWPTPSATLRGLEALPPDDAAVAPQLNREEFNRLAEEVAQTAPPGLSREEFRQFVVTGVRERERQALRDDRVEEVQITLMVWAIPPVFLYAFGWSAGWIRRGFRG